MKATAAPAPSVETLLLALALFGMDAGAQGARTGAHSVTDEAQRVRDSAGVRIVVGQATPRVARWQLSDQPLLEIRGTADTGMVFAAVAYAFSLPSGATLVAPFIPPTGSRLGTGVTQLLVFDSQGRLARTIGREGGGPSELRGTHFIARAGSRFVLVDRGHRGFLLLNPERGLLTRFDEPTGDGPPTTQRICGAFTDGSLVIGYQFTEGDPFEERFIRASPTGDSIRNALTPRLFQARMGRPRTPLAPEATWAVGDSALHYTPGTTYEIRQYSWQGKLTQIIRLPLGAHQVSSAERSAYVRHLERRYSTSYSDDDLPVTARKTHVAAVDMLLPAPNGAIWARDGQLLPLQGGTWRVFDRTGRQLATIVLPQSFQPFEIGNDYVLGAYEDSAGEVSVRRYAVVR